MAQVISGNVSGSLRLRQLAWIGVAAVSLGTAAGAFGQVMTISTAPNAAGGPIDRRYAQIQPTAITLPANQIDARGHQEILRTLLAEQGFAMRPLPRGKKGLTLAANGKLAPAGEGYLSQITEQGLSVKPGDRVVLSNVRIDRDRLVFDINGGPEHKHEFLRHIQIGVNGPPTQQVTQDDAEDPSGARITLTFAKFVPDVTPAQIKALLAPLISFDIKTPVQAYTDTLPPKLKDAILNHRVMVGMSTDMVLFALGAPEAKSREMDGQMPFEEWIYGHPPQDVNFVRVNGNRVIRVEIAKTGQPLEIFTQDEVAGMMTTDGRSVLADATPHDTRTIQMGDVHRDPDTQSATPAPTLRAPGEKLPIDDPKQTPSGNREGQMRPVIFPKDTTNDPPNTVDAHPAAAKPGAKNDPSAAPAEAPGPAAPNQSAPNQSAPAQGAPAVAAPPASPPSFDFLPARMLPAAD